MENKITTTTTTTTELWQSLAFTIHMKKQETLKALVHNQSEFFIHRPFSGFEWQ